MDKQKMANRIYRAFCEDEGLDDHPFQKAWDSYQEEFGTIEAGSLVDRLVHQAIAYAIEQLDTWSDE